MEHRFTRDDNLYEDFTVGETIVHPRGRTVSDGEHMLWTNFVLNTAQLHFNQKMCDDSPQTTFDGRRVVYDGLDAFGGWADAQDASTRMVAIVLTVGLPTCEKWGHHTRRSGRPDRS